METIHVLAEGLQFPESPAFDAAGNLWCAEQTGEGLFCRYTDGRTKRVRTGGKPRGLACYEGDLWFCDSERNTVRRINIRTEEIETIIDQHSGRLLDAPYDLIFDESGNLIITCPGPSNSSQNGYVAVYSANGVVDIIAEGLLHPTGLNFYPDTQTLLIAEADQQRIWSGYWDSVGTSWEAIRVWATVDDNLTGEAPASLAGMDIGPNKNLYATLSGAGIVRIFSADGSHLRDIELPGKNPSNCLFDPSGTLGLVVTETEKGQLLSVLI